MTVTKIHLGEENMGISVNTNISALLAQQYLNVNQAGYAQAQQRLASGFRINSAADDPAGLAISTSMTNTSGALRQGVRNGNDGISLVQTAQSAISSISNVLTQMVQLAAQGSSGTYSSAQLGNLDTQFQALLTEINRVATVTNFNGVSLLANSTGSVSIQVGSNNTSNDRLSITLTDMTTGSAGLNISTLSLSSNANAQSALNTLQNLTAVNTALAALGASQVNLTAAVNYDGGVATSLDAAKSRIMDADFTVESTNLAKYNVLNQSNIAMLAQANSAPQQVLQLLRQ